MAAGKYKKWLQPDGLTLLSGWARNGLTDEQIAKNIGIGLTTFYCWKNDYPEFREAIRKGKEIIDLEVENALLKKALGFTVPLKRTFKIKVIDYDPESGRKVREREELATGIDEVYVQPDTIAQMFWLKNRKPKDWKEKREENDTTALDKVNELLKGFDQEAAE